MTGYAEGMPVNRTAPLLPACRLSAPKPCSSNRNGPLGHAGPGTTPELLLLQIDAEEVGLCRTARTDVVFRGHTRRHVVLIDQTRAGNPREIRFTNEALHKGGRRGPGRDGYHRC